VSLSHNLRRSLARGLPDFASFFLLKRPWARHCFPSTLLLLISILLVLPISAKPAPWREIKEALLRVNDAPVKEWAVFETGKKRDPLLLQLGDRYLLIAVHDHKLYEVEKAKIEHKGEELLLDPGDHSSQSITTSGWGESDVGTAFRIEVKIDAENRLIVLELPHPLDIGNLPMRSPATGERRGRR
jgi:hypothetical protein